MCTDVGDGAVKIIKNQKNRKTMKIRTIIVTMLVAVAMSITVEAQNNVAEEIAWVVGSEPIFKSDIEEQYRQALAERAEIPGNPYCVIPERMAVDKLFLDQAKIDTIEVQSSMVMNMVESRINFWIANLGSKEKVEEYYNMTMPDLRAKLIDMYSDQYKIEQVQSKLTEKVKATPADVRNFFEKFPTDSLPYIPRQVEVQIITINPVIPQQEIDEVKSRLRDYTQRVNKGEAEFSTLAILYSEDGSSMYGGEVGFKGRAELLPEYANAAFNLSDTKKVSKIVETEAGFHIIQLIERRGDRVNTRHILLRPKIAEKDLTEAVSRLDTVRSEIQGGKVTFEQAAMLISQDKDSRLNNGVMLNSKTLTNRFEMADLPAEVAKKVDKMNEGDISEPFVMMNAATNRQQVAIVKLMKRIEGHKANITDDYQTLKAIYEQHRKGEIIENWVKEKQKSIYVYIEDGWRNCDFQYEWSGR